ncbi:hypothetical protein [Kribbella sp. NPDC051718]|uniref:hypothetical protein n=1 Tax=Kribbella sp. NPDC051718 TaxID=3155168 RepID=UPI0034377018
MKLQRLALALAGVGLLASTATSTAGATSTAPTSTGAVAEICWNTVVWPTLSGLVDTVDVTAHKPPTVVGPPYVYSKFFATRYMDTWYSAWNASLTQNYAFGLFLQGPNLYRHTTVLSARPPLRPKVVKVGTGWAGFRAIAASSDPLKGIRSTYLYGLNSNGNLYRYAPNGAGYKAAGSFAGFKSFKTMTVVGEGTMYDTLLMTTKAGALYTIHIPMSAKPKPVVKLVRKSGWASYESLVVDGCGADGGSIITAVDHDTNTGYQYLFTKFKGTATAITSYGKVPASFNGINHVAVRQYNWGLLGE